MFCIYEIRPAYCGITDGMIGNTAHRLPMTYHSERLAQKLAARIEQAHYDNCGDSGYKVVPVGVSPFASRHNGHPLTWNDAVADEAFPF